MAQNTLSLTSITNYSFLVLVFGFFNKVRILSVATRVFFLFWLVVVFCFVFSSAKVIK